MATNFLIKLVSKTPWQDIDNISYCIWRYQISWNEYASELTSQIGLIFSNKIDIKDPNDYKYIEEIQGTQVIKIEGEDKQYISSEIGEITDQGKIEINFLSTCSEDSFSPVQFGTKSLNDSIWVYLKFQTEHDSSLSSTHAITAPAVICNEEINVDGKKNSSNFKGQLPYASEMFGVYQPLVGWIGHRSAERIVDQNMLNFIKSLRQSYNRANQLFSFSKLSNNGFNRTQGDLSAAEAYEAVLSPIGLVTLYREYFFEFDNFLGPPSGHLWLSPGGTVEVVESSTRRTLVEKSVTQSETSTTKVEESLTKQEDIADAIKEDNANDTKLGVSASAGGKFAGFYHAEGSASFSNQQTTRKSSEVTHKHTRTQSSRMSSEIQRNFKTTFKIVTETTDVTSRRYVVQNTTDKLANYELRRKMRKVGIQVQHIGTRLSWQVFFDTPGKDLGLGSLIHVIPSPDLSSLKKPIKPPKLLDKDSDFTSQFTLQKYGDTENAPHQHYNYIRSDEASPGGVTGMHSEDNDDHIVGDYEYTAPAPSPGYTMESIRTVAAKVESGGNAQFLADYEILDKPKGKFKLKARFLNFGGGRIISFTVSITWSPPAVDPALILYESELADYMDEVEDLQRKAYAVEIRDRINLVSNLTKRPSEDLRKEERHIVYSKLIKELSLISDRHINSELIRQLFDINEMLYFVAPDYWRPRIGSDVPRLKTSLGRYSVPEFPLIVEPRDPIENESVGGWYSHTEKNNILNDKGEYNYEWRINYLITDTSQAAPFGSSLGWLIQIDGDERRNEFINAAWVKAVFPIRAGQELNALYWLFQANVEGVDGLDQNYPLQPGDPENYNGKTLREVLTLLAEELKVSNTDMANTLASEKVFETGFDPLETGFRPATPYQVFDEWIEVLPTDQVVAVEVIYDPKTGKLN